MAHNHGIKKVDGTAEFDCSDEYLVIKNISGRTLTFGSPVMSVFPQESLYVCGENEKVSKFIKEKKFQVIEKHSAKPKQKKSKDEKSEETLITVATPEVADSVQLSSSEDDIALTSEQL